MSAHTPGPWSVIDGHYPQFREIKGPSFTISIVLSATDLDFSDYLKREADAQLIAAAPDMLAALYAVLHDCDNLDMVESNEPGRDIGPWEMANAAIAKATGGAA